MTDVTVVPGVFRQYGAVNAGQAATVAAAGLADQAAAIAASVPVFGPIGADFLAVFAKAQANHLQSVGQLAVFHGGAAAAAEVAAGAYEGADAASAGNFKKLT